MKSQIQKKYKEIIREPPRFQCPLSVRSHAGKFVERFGHLGINGVVYQSDEIPMLGQFVDVKIVLLGLGTEVKTRARVVRVEAATNHVQVTARFEDIPFHTERMIARWLDLLVHAHRAASASV